MKTIISIARVLSALFRPVYYPIVGFIILFTFTYMSIFPWVFKLWVVVMVYVFTCKTSALEKPPKFMPFPTAWKKPSALSMT